MSFDILLIPSSATPEGDAFVEATLAATLALGGSTSRYPALLITHDDLAIEVFPSPDACSVALRDQALSVIELVFSVADATKSFILPVESPDEAWRTPTNGGDPPGGEGEFPPIASVSTPAELEAKLFGGLQTWSNYREQVLGASPPKPPSFLGRLFGGLFGKAS